MNTKTQIKSVSEWGIFDPSSNPIIIAGPCSAESEEQVFSTAQALKAGGVNIFRAGIWKPRTRPNSFEGVGVEGLPWLQRVQRELGMKVAIEVASAQHVREALAAGVDILWIGARTTPNPFLMQEIADALRGTDTPVLVKNPVNPDMGLWIGALERLNQAGLSRLGIILRGFTPFSKMRYRNDPQWSLFLEMRKRYPEMLVICDPSHISGRREYIPALAQQALDLGFDGLMIESHVCPQSALSDNDQQLTPSDLLALLDTLTVSEDCTAKAYELRATIDMLDDALLDTLRRRIALSRKAAECSTSCEEYWAQIASKINEQGAECDAQLLEEVFAAIRRSSER